MMTTFDLDEYVRANSVLFEDRLAQSIKNDSGHEMMRRQASLDIGREVMRFVSGVSENRLIVLPGLRGVGKTTILNQLHHQLIEEGRIPASRILHVSMDEAMGILGVGLFELAGSMERLIGKAMHSLRDDEKTFILVDEAQYDPKWGIAAKAIFDKARNVCQVITGSSALDPQVNPDVARRASSREVWPMDLGDYQLLRKGSELSSIGGQVTRCLLTATNVAEARRDIEVHSRD
jgi:predicted AAA+ superfamily ATPase